MFADIRVGLFVALVYLILLNVWPGLDVHVFVLVWCVRTSFRGVLMSLCATFCHHDLWADPISFFLKFTLYNLLYVFKNVFFLVYVFHVVLPTLYHLFMFHTYLFPMSCVGV